MYLIKASGFFLVPLHQGTVDSVLLCYSVSIVNLTEWMLLRCPWKLPNYSMPQDQTTKILLTWLYRAVLSVCCRSYLWLEQVVFLFMEFDTVDDVDCHQNLLELICGSVSDTVAAEYSLLLSIAELIKMTVFCTLTMCSFEYMHWNFVALSPTLDLSKIIYLIFRLKYKCACCPIYNFVTTELCCMRGLTHLFISYIYLFIASHLWRYMVYTKCKT
jgi:hypothetical protein